MKLHNIFLVFIIAICPAVVTFKQVNYQLNLANCW